MPEAQTETVSSVVKKLYDLAEREAKGEISGAELSAEQRKAAKELVEKGETEKAFQLIILAGQTENREVMRQIAGGVSVLIEKAGGISEEMAGVMGKLAVTVENMDQAANKITGAAGSMEYTASSMLQAATIMSSR